MMLDVKALQCLTQDSPCNAWKFIAERALNITSQPLTADSAAADIIGRDREIGVLDLFLSSSGWDLWQFFGDCVERTSECLADWWKQPSYDDTGRAVLILDALSLRELPWLLQGAKERGFSLHSTKITASELPGETNEFAQALGFSSRSKLQNNGAGSAHKLHPAHTETVNYSWKDCEMLLGKYPAAKNWVFWHHWPDTELHNDNASQGLRSLAEAAAERLSCDDFWVFVERLATGRQLVITSDHGYAATGQFPDAPGDAANYLKQKFKSARNTTLSQENADDAGPFVPPVALKIGNHLLALGRRKWRSQGGYPTLAHGGLSLLEVLSPFIELSKTGG